MLSDYSLKFYAVVYALNLKSIALSSDFKKEITAFLKLKYSCCAISCYRCIIFKGFPPFVVVLKYRLHSPYCSLFYTCGSVVQHRRRGFNSWLGKIPWRRKWQPTPVFLPGESHGQRSLADYSPWGHKKINTT